MSSSMSLPASHSQVPIRQFCSSLVLVPCRLLESSDDRKQITQYHHIADSNVFTFSAFDERLGSNDPDVPHQCFPVNMQHFQKRLLPCLCHYLRCPLIYKSGCSHVCRTVITGSRTGREHVPEIFDDTVIIFVYIVRCQREPRQGIMLYLTISHDYHIIATKIFIYLHSVQDFNPVCRIFGIPGPPRNFSQPRRTPVPPHYRLAISFS